MYAAKERETLVIETAHFFRLGCFGVHGILQKHRGQAVKNTVFAATVRKSKFTVAGFETTDRRDFYDLAIGNVPFGQYQVNDRAYNKLGFSIHDYFFAKALDQVRPGGVVAFVTSRYTMDKQLKW